MASFFEWLQKIDRRYIFLVIGVLVLASFFVPLKMAIKDTKPVRNIFDTIEKMDDSSCVILSFDFDPSSEPELMPMAKAVMRQCFKNKVKIIAIALWPQGAGLAENALASVAEDFGAKRGEDWVNLGWKPGVFQVIIAMADDITKMFPQDFSGRSTKDMEIFKKIKNYSNVNLIACFAAGTTPDSWVAFAYTKYKKPVCAGVTAVMAADYYPYLQTKQLIGIINGLKGAAEYEMLVNKPEKAMLGMTPQSAVHIVIILFIVVGNIGFFLSKRNK